MNDRASPTPSSDANRKNKKPKRRHPAKRGGGSQQPSAGGKRGPNVTPGVLVRRSAARIVSTVTMNQRTLDDALTASLASELAHLEGRDIAFARLIAVTTLRRLGQIDDVLRQFLTKPIDKRAPFARAVLQTAVAQLLFLDTPAHAVIDVSVRAIKAHKKSQHFSGLTNAVLRRVAEKGAPLLEEQNAGKLNAPEWMFDRWRTAYGAETAQAIAEAHLTEPALDLSIKKAGAPLPDGLAGQHLATGSLRLPNDGRIDALPGYEAGEWWVQDAAAALPARLLGPVAGKRVLDLCAAPGGKTAQLCAAGALVTAVDSSASRMKRVEANLARLNLEAQLVVADALTWRPEPAFDAVLLDAPCSATGTLRRHPDIALLKSKADILELAAQQQEMLRATAERVAPGGTLVFCTCSLEPEEGAEQLATFLAAQDNFTVDPITAGEFGIPGEWITPGGCLRTLPSHTVPIFGSDDATASPGVDGFFAVRLKRHN